MNKSEHISNLAAALCKAQGEMSAVPFDSTNPFLKNRFASLGAIIEHSRPILVKHGLSICQFPISEHVSAQQVQAIHEAAEVAKWQKEDLEAKAKISVTTSNVGIESILMHESGEWLSERILLPLADEKGKSLAQVAGSVTTYLKRYSWASLLGLYAEEDTDGNGAEVRSQGTGVRKPQPKPAAPKPSPATPEADAWASTLGISGPSPEARLSANAPETDVQKLARFLKLFTPYKPYATEVFRQHDFILSTESYDAISIGNVNSFSKANVDALLADVKRCAGVSDDVPEPEGLPPQIANIIVPIPRKGMKRDEYLKAPDTIGSLYAAASDDEEAARRLFGLVSNYAPAPWVGKDGKQRPPSQVDVRFREALDRFAEWREKHGDK